MVPMNRVRFMGPIWSQTCSSQGRIRIVRRPLTEYIGCGKVKATRDDKLTLFACKMRGQRACFLLENDEFDEDAGSHQDKTSKDDDLYLHS